MLAHAASAAQPFCCMLESGSKANHCTLPALHLTLQRPVC